MNITFREINETDFKKCAEVLAAAYQGKPWNNPWTLGEALLRIEATMSGINARGWVALVEGNIVGMCLGRIDYYYSGWSQFCVDEYNALPAYQGKGIGSKLMNVVSDLMKQDKVARMFLITGGEKAAKFYYKAGFEKSDDGTMMALELSE